MNNTLTFSFFLKFFLGARCKFIVFCIIPVLVCSLHSRSVFADSVSGSFTCTSGKVCRMQLQSVYNGHSIEPAYDYDITGWKSDDAQVDNDSVIANVTYTYSDGTSSYANNIKIPLNHEKNRYFPSNRPDSNKKVEKLVDTVYATFKNESSETKTISINIDHRYGENSDRFTYTVNVLPPPPVCTTSVSNPNLDMGTFTTSQLAALSPGQSTGVSKSVKVISQCSYSAGINISLSTNKVTSGGYLVAGGGLNFLTDIDGKKTVFGSDGKISFSVNSASRVFDLGFTGVRSDDKPTAGNFNNIITITTTPL